MEKQLTIDGGAVEILTRIERAEADARAAWQWTRDNPQAWKFVWDKLQAAKAAGVKTSMRRITDHIAWHDFQDVNGSRTRAPHNGLSAGLARIALFLDPELEGTLVLSKSRYDGLNMGDYQNPVA